MPRKVKRELVRVEGLVLVSSSPRRREILEPIVPELTVANPKCRELLVRTHIDLELNAKAKLESVRLPKGSIAVAADTAVFLNRKALGKPGSDAAARRMLRRLSGKWHTVFTALAVGIDGSVEEALVRTEVRFRRLSDRFIGAYVATGEPLDKAGGYGIQGLGGLLVEEIAGDYYNVVGLPLARLEEILEARGYTLLGGPDRYIIIERDITR